MLFSASGDVRVHPTGERAKVCGCHMAGCRGWEDRKFGIIRNKAIYKEMINNKVLL